MKNLLLLDKRSDLPGTVAAGILLARCRTKNLGFLGTMASIFLASSLAFFHSFNSASLSCPAFVAFWEEP